MVTAAGAAAGGIFRAGIVVTARLRAVTALRQLSQVLLQSNNAFIRFGRSAVIATGAMEVIRRSIGLLVNPVTGVLALLQTGLATRRWFQFETAIRRARVQLDLMGIQAEVANERLRAITRQLGRMAAREVFQAGLAIQNLFSMKLPDDLLTSILGAAENLSELSGVPVDEIARDMAGLAIGGDAAATALVNLNAVFPGLVEPGDKLRDVLEKLFRVAESLDTTDSITNMEKLGQKIDEVNDRLDPVLGKLSDVLTTFPLVAVTVTETLISMVEAFIKGLPAVLEPLSLALSLQFQEALGKLLEDQNLVNAMAFAGGAIGLMIGGPMGAAAGVAFGFFLGRGIDKVIKEGDFTQAMTVAGVAIGFLIGGPLVAAIGLAIGFTLGNVINLAMGKAISTSEFIVSMAVIGGIIGFLIGGPLGAALGAGVGSIVGALVQRFKDQSIMETIRQIGRDIGNEIVRMINEAIKLINLVLPGPIEIPEVPSIPTPPNLPAPPPPPESPGDGEGPGQNISGPPDPDDPRNIGLASGGIVPGPRGAPIRAIVHGGERVIPVGGNFPEVINIFIGEEKIATILNSHLTKMAKRQGLSPRSMSHL